jgi:uncharacterized protein YndB with AHSA1/START domain
MGEIRHQVLIEASPAKVYAALATQSGLRGWWTADNAVDDKVGGTAEFRFEKRAAIYRMTIAARDPGREVIWLCRGENPEWNGTTLTWMIEPDGGGSRLHFTQSGWREMTDWVAMCNSTWGELMYRLKNYVEGRNPGPRWAA